MWFLSTGTVAVVGTVGAEGVVHLGDDLGVAEAAVHRGTVGAVQNVVGDYLGWDRLDQRSVDLDCQNCGIRRPPRLGDGLVRSVHMWLDQKTAGYRLVVVVVEGGLDRSA